MKHHIHDVPEDKQYICEEGSSRTIERRANKFSAELLMPINMIQRVAEELRSADLITITTLSNAFNVSYPAMVFRLNSLGYITDHVRDNLLSDSGKEQDKQETWAHNGSRKIAHLKTPALIAAFGYFDRGFYCQGCSDLVIDDKWIVCPNCNYKLK